MISTKIPLPNVRIYDSEVLTPNCTYFIFCEGNVLEYKYFNGLKGRRKFVNLNSLIKLNPVMCCENNPKKIIDEVIDNIDKYIEFDEINESDYLLFVFDRDEQSFTEDQYDYVISKNNQLIELVFDNGRISRNKIIIAVSNSSFEFWLMCHYLNRVLGKTQLQDVLANEKIGSKPYNKKKISDDIGLNIDNFGFDSFMRKCSAQNYSDYKSVIDRAINHSKKSKYVTKLDLLKTQVGTNVGLIIESIME